MKRSFNSYKSHNQKIKIAILEPDIYPAAEKVREGFLSQMTYKRSFYHAFQVLNARGGRDLLVDLVMHAVDDCDLIFSIGPECSVLAKEIAAVKRKTIPIVFSKIKDPIRLGIVHSLTRPNSHITGCTQLNQHHEEQLAYLFKIIPKAKKILTIYNPEQENGFIEEEQKTIYNLLKKQGVNLHTIRIHDKNDIITQINKALKTVTPDAILILYDSTTLAHMSQISQLADSHFIPVYASDIESVRNGATLGYGCKEESIGTQCAVKALEIIEQNIDPIDMPITIMNEIPRLRVNKQSADINKLVIDNDLIINHHVELM